MTTDNLAVCFALNDKHRAWYEMLIPFIMSLKKTDYKGQIFVISYGLSEQKKALLAASGVKTIEAAANPRLPIGRYLEAAKIIDTHPEIEKLALYDADIWFCSPHFDLFEYVVEDRIYAVLDCLWCTFVTDPLIGENRAALYEEVFAKVQNLYGNPLQAGLTAGSRKAWTQFSEHIQACMQGIGIDFQDRFGIDTTFLNLWAARDGLSILSPVQNYITTQGVAEQINYQNGDISFKHSGQDIRALHMAGHIRFLNCWRYYTNNVAHALEYGEALALSPQGAMRPVATYVQGAEHLASMGLEFISASLEADDFASLQIIKSPYGVILNATGNFELHAKAVQPIAKLEFSMTHPSGYPSPIRNTMSVDRLVCNSLKDLRTTVGFSMVNNSILTLKSESLGGQRCESIWIISNEPEILQ
jgi:hypothetical protein